MSNLPDYEPQKLPEGSYVFTLKEEPEKRRQAGKAGDFISVKFVFKVSGNNINPGRQHVERFVPWDEKYGQLLEALGGKRGNDGRVHLSESVGIVGQSFHADIIHVPDNDDPTKSWARLSNIRALENEGIEEEDDIPF